MNLVLVGALLSFSFAAEAGRKPHYKNLQYMPLEVQAESCRTLVREPTRESIECLYFEHSVRTAREAGSGLAEGRRSSARLSVRPELPELSSRIVRLVRSNDIKAAQRAWKHYLQRLAQIPYPIDLNEEIIWIAREAYIKADPGLDLRLKEFASTAEASGLAADRVAEYERLLSTCAQIPNCSVREIQESLSAAKTAFQEASSSNEVEMIKLQSAISARGQWIQLVSNMINAFNETTKNIVGNIR